MPSFALCHFIAQQQDTLLFIIYLEHLVFINMFGKLISLNISKQLTHTTPVYVLL